MTRRETDAPGRERGPLRCGEAAWGWDERAGGLGTAADRGGWDAPAQEPGG